MDDLLRRLEATTEEMYEIAARKNNPAGYMHERLVKLINAQQSLLREDLELGVQVVGGSAPPFHLRSIGYSNPDILVFVGRDANGNTVQLMQHHSQMSVYLVALPKLEEKAFRIGFTP